MIAACVTICENRIGSMFGCLVKNGITEINYNIIKIMISRVSEMLELDTSCFAK